MSRAIITVSLIFFVVLFIFITSPKMIQTSYNQDDVKLELVIFGFESCPPCKKLKNDLSNPFKPLKRYVENNFDKLEKLDINTPKGIEKLKEYNMKRAFPAIAVVETKNGKSSVIKRIYGYYSVQKLIKELKNIRRETELAKEIPC